MAALVGVAVLLLPATGDAAAPGKHFLAAGFGEQQRFELDGFDEEIDPHQSAAGAGELIGFGSRDTYAVEADGGKPLHLEVTRCEAEEDSFAPVWWLTGPSGNELATGPLCDRGIQDLGVDVRMPGSGTYQLTVATTADGAGTYGIRFSRSHAESFKLPIPGSVGLDQPGSGAGEIGAPNEHDVYEFTGKQGQLLLIDPGTCALTSGSELLVDVIGPDGEAVHVNVLCDAESTYPQWVFLEVDGPYQLFVSGRDGTMGTYDLQLRETNGELFEIRYGQAVRPGTPGPGAARSRSPARRTTTASPAARASRSPSRSRAAPPVTPTPRPRTGSPSTSSRGSAATAPSCWSPRTGATPPGERRRSPSRPPAATWSPSRA